MSEINPNESKTSEAWDEGDARPAVKVPRAVVLVTFARDDFELVAEQAKRHDMTTSEYIRQAAIESVTPL